MSFFSKKTAASILVIAFLATIGFAITANAADFKFQTTWPKSPMGTDIMAQTNPSLAIGIKYIYEWGVGLGGMAVFVSLIIAGFEYITSIGNPSKMQDAFNRIRDAVIGLIVLLSSYAILTMIGINLNGMKINMFDGYFTSPMRTCAITDSKQAAPECCKIEGCVTTEWSCVSGKCARAAAGTSPGATGKECTGAPDECCAIKGCEGTYYACAGYDPGPPVKRGYCVERTLKEPCDKVTLFYETDSSESFEGEDQQTIDNGKKIKYMVFYKDDKPCYDPTAKNASNAEVVKADNPSNPVCSCGLQLFTKKLTASETTTNPCENADVFAATNNDSLKLYTKAKDVVCVMLIKQ